MNPITDKIKELGVPRYESERLIVRKIAIENTKDMNICLELYAGNGGMSKLYDGFKKIITVDKDKMSTAEYKMPALEFIEKELPKIKKVGLVDFDAYGGPQFEIQAFFKEAAKRSAPFTMAITDGLGLGMKRSDRGIRERFLVDGKDVKMRIAWKGHRKMTYLFITRLAEKYGLKAEPLVILQGKGKNFVFSSWLIK